MKKKKMRRLKKYENIIIKQKPISERHMWSIVHYFSSNSEIFLPIWGTRTHILHAQYLYTYSYKKNNKRYDIVRFDK